MSQHDMLVDNDTGRNVRLDINDALAALVSNSSGATEPSTMFAFQLWADTTNNLLKIRNAANNAWITVGTLSAVNLGLLSLAGGTLTGALLLATAGSASSPDLSFSGDSNTGIFRAGADLLGWSAGGVELARLDGVLGYLKLLGTAGLLMPSGTTAERPTGVTGLIRHNSTLGKFEGYSGGLWKDLGGGGGGSGILWVQDTDAPVSLIENNQELFVFGDGLSQYLYALLKVPASYVAGTQIKMYLPWYASSSTNTILMQSLSTLVRSGVDAISTTTNQRTSTNAAVANIVDTPQIATLDITDSSGQINSVAVSANDLIKVRLQRGTGSNTNDAKIPVYGTEVSFNG